MKELSSLFKTSLVLRMFKFSNFVLCHYQKHWQKNHYFKKHNKHTIISRAKLKSRHQCKTNNGIDCVGTIKSSLLLMIKPNIISDYFPWFLNVYWIVALDILFLLTPIAGLAMFNVLSELDEQAEKWHSWT